ncbi:MAG: hypothetical protein NTX03_12840 [Bacteroidetes bacterium]|nr:hypothetical protein [Bacteroidota bacterium]
MSNKISLFFVLAICFFTFTAQNCTHRDPREEIGTRNSPSKVGLQYASIFITVKTDVPTNLGVSGAFVYVALSKDSMTAKQYLKIGKTSTDSTNNANVQITDLQLFKDYWFHAEYKDGGGNLYTTKSDTFYRATSYQLPPRKDLIVTQ